MTVRNSAAEQCYNLGIFTCGNTPQEMAESAVMDHVLIANVSPFLINILRCSF